jgi:periplasmic mercuric ion binding protein
MRKPLVTGALAFAALVLTWSAQAADKTVTLDVKNADCVLCPTIVRKSLLRVPGVKDVKTTQANRMAAFMATVTYDDAVANETGLIAATTKAGYPSHIASAR